MGQTLLLLPVLNSNTGRRISSSWGLRISLQTGFKFSLCPGIQTHLSALLQQEITTMAVSFLPSTPLHLSIISWVHKQICRASEWSHCLKAPKEHDWLAAVPFHLGQTPLKPAPVSPDFNTLQMASSRKHGTPETPRLWHHKWKTNAKQRKAASSVCHLIWWSGEAPESLLCSPELSCRTLFAH